MAQEFKSGEIVLQSGIYAITHDAAHAEMAGSNETPGFHA